MKIETIYKYVIIALVGTLLGVSMISMRAIDKLNASYMKSIKEIENVWQSPLIVPYHDTVYLNVQQIQWKTKHDTAEFVIRDTFYHNDTTIIVKEKIMQPDTFLVASKYADSTIDATVHIQGTGIKEMTTIDSVSLQYKYIKKEYHRKKCCFLRKIFKKC